MLAYGNLVYAMNWKTFRGKWGILHIKKIWITDNIIVLEDTSVEITKILQIKITIKKWIHLKIKEKYQDATFVGQNFIGKKLSRCCRKIELWQLYEQLNTAFLEDSAESLVSETFNMALLDSRCTKMACGETCFLHYLHSLSFDEYKQIETSKSNSSFKFGNSKLVKSF